MVYRLKEVINDSNRKGKFRVSRSAHDHLAVHEHLFEVDIFRIFVQFIQNIGLVNRHVFDTDVFQRQFRFARRGDVIICSKMNLGGYHVRRA